MNSILLQLFAYVTLSSTYLLNNVNKHGIGVPGKVPNLRLPEQELFSQKLDHFDPTNKETWLQRYWTNASFYKPGGPVFLMINGEAAATAKWAATGQWMSYAEENSALCFLIEHRFYGESKPAKDTSSENLKYLSSEQALADLAYFIEGMNEKHQLPAATKRIVFGGSYAGSLAAWLRMKYPHLIHGAVSSSGPLLAKVDFYEYFQVVRASLAAYKDECVTEVSNANKYLDMLVSTRSGRAKVTKMFKLCDELEDDQDDIANLFQNLAGNFAEVVQYNEDNRECSTCNITVDILCDLMTIKSSGDTPLDRYVKVNNLAMSATNTSCLKYKYKQFIQSMQKTDWESASENGRQWLYQTCTEFGFYQTSSHSTDVFGRHLPVEFFTKQCAEIFGTRFDDNLLANGVGRTNIMYGALDINVGNIVYVHGSVDPWHALGLFNADPNKPYETIFIEGTAHCADMYPSSAKDSVLLRKARNKIRLAIKSWLSTNVNVARPSKMYNIKIILDKSGQNRHHVMN